MKILFVVSTLAGGGAERVLAQLANRWVDNHDIAIVTLKTNADFYPVDSRVRRLRLDIDRSRWYNPVPFFKTIAGLRRCYKQEKPDYVVSFVLKTNVFALLAGMGTEIPIIACEHSVIERPDIDLRVSFLRRITYPMASKIGVLSESIRAEFMSSYPAISPSRIAVIPNSIEMPDNSRNRMSVVPEGRNVAGFRLISLGRLIEIKNYEGLIEAFAVFWQRHSDSRLTIYGEGPDRARLEANVAQRGLADVVHLAGVTTDVFSALSEADAFVMTSRFEGMPMALLESMCAGIPSVCYDAPGVRDFIVDGYNGYSVRYGDAESFAESLERLATSPETRERMGRNAAEFAESFSPATIDKIWFERMFS